MRWVSKDLRRAATHLYHDHWITHQSVAWILFELSSLSALRTELRAAANDAADLYHGLGASR